MDVAVRNLSRMIFVPRWTTSCSISTSSVRNRKPPNIKSPNLPGFESIILVSLHRHPQWQRTKLLALAERVYPERHPSTEFIWQECPLHRENAYKVEYGKKANDFELIYAKELKERIEQSKMVAFFHMNSTSHRIRHKLWQNARRSNMELSTYNRLMATAALENTQWQNLLHFWYSARSKTYVAFSKEIQVSKLLTYDKKSPEIFLLGVLVENRILTKKELQNMATMPSIDLVRGELVSLLQLPVQKTISLLQSNPQNLSRNLEQLIKDKQEK